MRPRLYACLALCAALVPWPAAAQRAAARPASPGAAQAAPSAALPPRVSPPVIEPAQALILIRSHLAALQAADQTGDYRVLYEMGSHDFQIANPPEKLAAIFARLRAYNLNAVLLDTPAFDQPPFIDPAGRLTLKGVFLKDGYRVAFLLIFQSESGTWKLFGIGANVSPAKA